MGSPTVRRRGVKILCALASYLRWNVRALDISQEFPQSGNLRPGDRIIVLPPAMVTLPWAGHLPPVGTDLETISPTQHVFLLLLPLYGGRGGPMRWAITLTKRLRAYGFRLLQCDVCAFTKHNENVNWMLFRCVASVIFLFMGTDGELLVTEKVLRAHQSGEIEKLTA